MAFVGALREVALTKEATRGTADGPDSGDFISHEAHSIRPQIDKAEHMGANGTINQRHKSDIIHEWTQGNIPFVLEQSKLWLLGALITGADPSTAGSDPYTHDYTLANTNAHKTFTVNYTDPVKGDLAAPNGLANTINLTASTDNYVTADVEMIAGKSESATFTPSYNTSNITYFKPDNMSFKLATNYAGLSGASAVAISNLNLSVNKSVEPYWVLGSTEFGDVFNQRIAISGDFQIVYDAATYRDLGLSDNTRALSLNLTNGDYELTIELPTVDFQDWTEDEDNDSYVQNRVSFNATDADASNGLIKVQVIDSTATH